MAELDGRAMFSFVRFPLYHSRLWKRPPGPGQGYHDQLMKTLPNVQVVLDEAGRLTRQWTHLSSSMQRIRLAYFPDAVSASGRPESLSVEHLELLHITPSDYMIREELSDRRVRAVSQWPIEIGIICRNLKSLGELHLRLPGLSTCGCSRESLKPQRLGDPLAEVPALGNLKALHLTVPYCDIRSDSQRKAQWVSS